MPEASPARMRQTGSPAPRGAAPAAIRPRPQLCPTATRGASLRGAAALLLLLCAALAACGRSAGAPAVAGFAPFSAARAAQLPSLHGAALLGVLPPHPDLKLEAGEVHWKSGSTSYRVLEGRRGRELWIEADRQPVRVSWALADRAFGDPLRDLVPALAQARAAGIPTSGLRLEYVPLLREIALVSRGAYVLPAGVLRRSAPLPSLHPPGERAQARRELHEAQQRVRAELEKSDLGESARRAIEQLVERLDRSAVREAGGEPAPEVLRGMLRHGWLQRALPELASAPTLAAALERAAQSTPVLAYRGAGQQVEVREDALGERVTWLRAPGVVRYARALPAPAYIEAPELSLVVDLAPGAAPDGAPLQDAASWTEARVYRGELELARAQPGGAFSADAERWRREVAVHGRPLDDSLLPDAFPPHVFVVSPAGDPLALVTRHGVLAAPQGTQPAALESFLDSAARALPDAAHLDLLGERFHTYAYDSPDPTRPELIGTAELSGDIHQTAQETLSRASGGMLYGDCDDLSELYQSIASRQGHNAQMLGLPAHAALAWTEQQDDGRWWTYVLQTGPPVAFAARSARGSVEAAYRELGGTGSTTGDQLEILLRFAGENTRDSYFLSHRIFEDPAYARAMIELQQNWHDWTLYRGTRAIRERIARGDDSSANRIELGAFQASTLRYPLAAQTYRDALERTSDPAERVYLRTELAQTDFELGETEQARAEVHSLLDVELGSLGSAASREEWLDSLIGLAQLLAEKEREPELALEVLSKHAQPILDARSFWYRNPMEQLQLERFMRTAIRVLDVASRHGLRDSKAWSGLSTLVGNWFEEGAFGPSELATSPLSTYSLLGHYYRVLKPESLAAIRGAAAPDRADRDHAARGDESHMAALDFGWIAIAPQFWWGELQDALQPVPRSELDRPAWLELAHRTRVARAQAVSLGLDRPEFEQLDRLSELATALLRGRPGRLRAALGAIRATGDRGLADDAADTLASIGPHLPEAEFARDVDVALDALPLRRLYFRIAWRCAADGAKAHALIAARKAAAAFADDPAFAEEYRQMRAGLR